MNSLHRERKPPVRVQVHNSPPQYTPRTIPTSPDGLPTFEYDLETQLTDAKPNVRNNQAKRSLISLPIKTKNERDLKGKNPKEEQTTVTIGHKNQNKPHTVARQKEKTSLQINEERKKMMGKSLKVTDIGSLSPKQPRRSQTIKNEKTEIDYEWKTLLKNEFPPYNPLDFVPDERNSESIDVTKTCKIKKMHAMDENRELLEKIRQELDQWMAESSREGTCPEHWDTTQRECKDDAQTIMPTPNGQSTARGHKKKSVITKEDVAVQSTPSLAESKPKLTLACLENSNLFSLNLPNTPSLKLNTNTLKVAEQLLSIAEKEFNSSVAKLPEDFSRKQTFTMNASELSSPRRIMTDVSLNTKQSSSVKRSEVNLQSSYHVPQNSPYSSNNRKSEVNYSANNGEQKKVKSNSCTAVKHSKSTDFQNDSNKPQNLYPSHVSGFLEEAAQVEMFHEQKMLSQRSEHNYLVEKRSASSILELNEGKDKQVLVTSRHSISKCDVETNTDPEDSLKPNNKCTAIRNSGIINMKESNPETEIQPEFPFQKHLHLQKMPSVNIRPEFKIQKGPKINIAPSTTQSHYPRRRNAEFFDIVYPSSTNSYNVHFNSSEMENQLINKNSCLDYVCERHVFPSGRLVHGRDAENYRPCGNYNLESKKELLTKLIKSVSEKIDKQAKGRDGCCRLSCSLPLLVSAVNKIRVDCVKCVNVLNNHLDTLITLMKEELRDQRDLSDNHCCQLDETVQYQIVELELIQDVNSQELQHSGAVSIIKHQDDIHPSSLSKKTVSFESSSNNAVNPKCNRLPEKLANGKNSMNSKNTTKNIEKRIRPGLQPIESSSKYIKENVTAEKNQVNSLRKTPIHPRAQVTPKMNQKAIVDTYSNKKERLIVNDKDKTNINQPSKQSTLKKTILKNNSNTNKINPTNLEIPKNSGIVLNAYSQIVDYKDTAEEVDEWIEERSKKIKQIHDELNKMISRSVEKYVEYRPSSVKSPVVNVINSEENNLIHNVSEHQVINSESYSSHVRTESLKGDTNNVKELPIQPNSERNQNTTININDENVDYSDDFEEIEEYTEGSVTDVQHQEALPEGESRHSSSSNMSEILTNEDELLELATNPTSVNNSGDLAESRNLCSSGNKPEDDMGCMQLLSPSEGTEEKTKVNLVNTGTSPINLLNSQVQHKEHDNSAFKTSIATSPINQEKISRPEYKSTNTQTSPELPHKVSKDNNSGGNLVPVGTPLTVPCAKLNPTPVENVFQSSQDNSFGINYTVSDDNSTSQMLKLRVQLPELSIHLNNKQKAIENQSKKQIDNQLDNLKPSSYSKYHSNEQCTQTNMKHSETDKSSSVRNLPNQKSLSKKEIEDIIEPTVLEVLKKINQNNESQQTTENFPLSSNPPKHDERSSNQNSVYSELIKPSIILQTNHGLWKKPVVIDLDGTKQTVNSSVQTEAEKQNASVQAIMNRDVSQASKAISARKSNETAIVQEKSYLEICQVPQSSQDTRSSIKSSSIHLSSSRSSSNLSSSLSSLQRETLSEGEVLPCFCVVGEVCSRCVPKLNLSFGELKTKLRRQFVGTAYTDPSDSESSSNLKSNSKSFPLHLSPRPAAPLISPKRGDFGNNSASTSKVPGSNPPSNLVYPGKSERQQFTFGKFSEIAKQVKSELNDEHLILSAKSNDERKVLSGLNKKDQLPTKSIQEVISSSDSAKSIISMNNTRRKKKIPGYENKSKTPLMITSPLESPRISMVIEESDQDTTYQTSLTSVSVDNLPGMLADQSSGEL